MTERENLARLVAGARADLALLETYSAPKALGEALQAALYAALRRAEAGDARGAGRIIWEARYAAARALPAEFFRRPR